MTSLKEYVDQNPLNFEEVLVALSGFKKFEPITFMVGLKYHRIEIDTNYGENPIIDAAEIGRNFNERPKISKFLNDHAIPILFDITKSNLEATLELRVFLNDEPMPFDESIGDIYKYFAEQSHIMVRFIVLVMAYENTAKTENILNTENIESTIREIVWRAFVYQKIGLFPLRSSDSIILVRGTSSPFQHSLPNFSWRPVTTPVQEAPSPMETIFSGKDAEGYTLVNRRKLYGSGPAPLSLVASYNPRNDDGIAKFEDYFTKGKAGIRGVIIPDVEIYTNYTTHFLKKHHTLANKEPSDEAVHKEMKKRLGAHYNEWVKIFPLVQSK